MNFRWIVLGCLAFTALLTCFSVYYMVSQPERIWQEFITAVARGDVKAARQLTDGTTLSISYDEKNRLWLFELLEKDFGYPIDIGGGKEVKNLKIHSLYRDAPMDYIQGKARVGRLDSVAFGHLVIHNGHIGFVSDTARHLLEESPGR